MAIHFYEKEESAGIKNKNLLKKWLKEMVMREDAIPGQINIILTSDRKVLELNKKYLSRDYLTDVITFDYVENQKVAGDIFISIPRVRENAAQYSVSYQNELKRVMAHGLLHLLGYDDKNEKDRAGMRKKEEHYLAFSPQI